MNVIAIIPARYSSTRLPGKPLVDIGGMPLIERVYKNVLASQLIDKVIVATDEQKIFETVKNFGGNVEYTSSSCASGSDRVTEVAYRHPADIYINIQGDEPFIKGEHIDILIQSLENHPEAGVSTLCHKISNREAINSNVVKIVKSNTDLALYFSRAPIPYPRDDVEAPYLVHRGVYAFRSSTLKEFANLPNSSLEHIEKLEQLRLLQANIPIVVAEVESFGPSIDTPQDLKNARNYLNGCKSIDDKIRNIKFIISDIDGVMTNGSLIYGMEGETFKIFNAKDGAAIKRLQATYQFAVISGRECEALKARLRDLDIKIFFLNSKDKLEDCKNLCEKMNILPDEILYIGDDIPDIEIGRFCGIFVCPTDSHPLVANEADIVLNTKGGQGIFAELENMLRTRSGQNN